MAFYAGRTIREHAMANPTVVVLTDRDDLDDQLFGTFARCQDLLRQPPVQAASRADLRVKLAVEAGGVVFTTIQKFFKTRWAQLEAIVGAEKRLKLVAGDIVVHFDQRLEAMDGKAMIVCMSRRICIDLYRELTRLRPEWHDEDDGKGRLKVVMTGSASDPLD